MNDDEKEVRCPLVIWALVLVAAVAGGDALLPFAAAAAHAQWVAYPLVVSFIAASVSAIVLEVLLARGWSCEWVETARARFAVYALSFVVGILLWSGVTVERSVPLFYRAIVIGLFVVPLLALATTHSTRQLNKTLRVFARLPVVVLLLIIATLLFFAITNYFY